MIMRCTRTILVEKQLAGFADSAVASSSLERDMAMVSIRES